MGAYLRTAISNMRILTVLSLLAATSAFSNPALEGDWMIELTSERAKIIGLLQLEQDDGRWRAWVEGGPAAVEVQGNSITVGVDSRDLRGFVFDYVLSGVLDDGTLSGTYSIRSDAAVRIQPGNWEGKRHVAIPRPAEPEPFDIAGTWVPAPGVDFRKYSMELTPAAKAWHEDYLPHYDQPNVRCVSPGIVAMVAWGGYPVEILDTAGRLTFLYEFDSQVRRIYLDGREPPEFFQHSNMGFSIGRWEGQHLVVETSYLERNIRDFRGEPLSRNARLEEVYSLSEDGERLSAVITLYDPENYERPPIRRRAWTRRGDATIYPYECDPDSFYRQMYNENLLDMYFERSQRRF